MYQHAKVFFGSTPGLLKLRQEANGYLVVKKGLAEPMQALFAFETSRPQLLTLLGSGDCETFAKLIGKFSAVPLEAP